MSEEPQKFTAFVMRPVPLPPLPGGGFGTGRRYRGGETELGRPEGWVAFHGLHTVVEVKDGARHERTVAVWEVEL